MEALGSADWILATYECPSKSRVHAACPETGGQPFYGWCDDGSSEYSSRF